MENMYINIYVCLCIKRLFWINSPKKKPILDFNISVKFKIILKIKFIVAIKIENTLQPFFIDLIQRFYKLVKIKKSLHYSKFQHYVFGMCLNFLL